MPGAEAAAAVWSFELGGGVELEVMPVKKGGFSMGSPESEAGRNPDEAAHAVTLTRDFYLGTVPVTVAQWERMVAETGFRSEAETGTSGGFGWNGTALEQRREFTWRNPGYPQTPQHPVVMVTWEDARQFLKWLSAKTGWTFDLPTEAQWEYAGRAGSATAWWMSGDTEVAGHGVWWKENAGNQAHPVTSLPPNPWGLHLPGNVWEWCADWYGPYDLRGAAAVDPVAGTPPPGEKPRRVLRGGSWLRPLKDTRSAARYRNDARSRNADNGFRVMSFGPPPGASPAGTGVRPATPAGAANAAGSLKNPAPPDTEGVPRELEPQDQRPSPVPGSGAGTGAGSGQDTGLPASPPSLPVDRGSEPAPLSGKRGGNWLPLLLSGLLGLWILRRIFRRMANPAPLPPRQHRSSPGPPPPPPLDRPLSLAPGEFLTRRMDDGFWLNAGLAAGTWLNLSWRDERGQLRERRVRYQPGDDGHFIYTGTLPDQMRVTAEDPDAGDAGGVPPLPFLPPALPGNGFPGEPGGLGGGPDAGRRGSRAGTRPSAY